MALGGCSSGDPTIELSAVAGLTGTPGVVPTVGSTTGPDAGSAVGSTVAPLVTSTVTVTAVDTRTVVATTTVVTTATVVATATVTLPATARPRATSGVFDRPAALVDYADLVDDVRILDAMTLAGNAAAVQLDLVAQRFERLGANGPPPGVDAPSYYGRLASLALFAHAASGEAAARSPVAPSRYAVIRQETGVLLSLVNGALATTFTLPAPGPRTPTTTTTR
jgi:hypothetical protein